MPRSAICKLEIQEAGGLTHSEAEGLRTRRSTGVSPQVEGSKSSELQCSRAGEDGYPSSQSQEGVGGGGGGLVVRII